MISAWRDASDRPRKQSASIPLLSTSPCYPSISRLFRSCRSRGWGRPVEAVRKDRKATSMAGRTAAGRTVGRTAWRATGRAACSREAIRSLVSWPCWFAQPGQQINITEMKMATHANTSKCHVLINHVVGRAMWITSHDNQPEVAGASFR